MKIYILSGFHIIRYQNAKIHAKTSKRRHKTKLQETYLLRVFLRVRHQNTKSMKRALCWKGKRNNQQSDFSRVWKFLNL